MSEDVTFFIALFSTPIIFIVAGILWRFHPPKNINQFYGYRTRRSMANQHIWDYANSLGAMMFLRLGFMLTILATVSYFVFPNKGVLIVLFLTLVGIGVGMYWCETQINKRFDKNGNPK